MKIVIAPNALKGSLTAVEAAHTMAEGVFNISDDFETVKVPVADGGDGLVDVCIENLNGEKISVLVKDPLFREITAVYCWLADKKTAVVEMANTSGLVLLEKKEQNPLKTTTFGTGELIRHALDAGAKKIIVGVGGSATTDGGIGMAAALGVKFLDQNNKEIIPAGENLICVTKIDISGLDQRIKNTDIEIVCDVDNTLSGEHGAARVYGPQKGADAESVELLEKGLKNLADIIQKQLGIDVLKLKGGGAAGGLGAGLYAFLNGKLKRGVDVVLDMVGLDAKLKGASLVLTSEGQIDNQTAFGKAPSGVAERAKKSGIPCIAIAGGINGDISELHKIGIDAVFSLCPKPMSLSEAMDSSAELLKNATEQAVRSFVCGRK